jgi:hypothetical protein
MVILRRSLRQLPLRGVGRDGPYGWLSGGCGRAAERTITAHDDCHCWCLVARVGRAQQAKPRASMVQRGTAVRVGLGLGIGVVALALLVCAPAAAQTPTPDPAPLPPPPPSTSEPLPPPPAEVPSSSTSSTARHPRVRRQHAKERRLLQPEVGPFHPSTAEDGPTVLARQAELVNTRKVLSAISADTGSIAHTDGPRPSRRRRSRSAG